MLGASRPGRPSYREGRPRGKGPPRRWPRSRGKRRPPEAGTGCLAGNGALETRSDQKPRIQLETGSTLLAGNFQQVLVNSP